MLKISELAGRIGLSAHTIRFMKNTGSLRPVSEVSPAIGCTALPISIGQNL
jgi:DNA-binding transcriptional MerR regulator